jgi:hypothetical protein
MLNAMGPNVPAYPGASLIPTAKVPDPPKLDPRMDEGAKVRLVALAFRAAVEAQYPGKRCFLLAKVSPKSKFWRMLVTAAEKLEEYGIAPMAWCVWSVRRWYLIRTHLPGYVKGAPVSQPPIPFVLSAKKIEERCAEEEKRYVVTDSAVGGRAIVGKTHKSLLVRYGEMRSAIVSGSTRAAAVAKFFPGSLYDDMVDAARAEAVEIRSRLESDAARGRMIW